ncbi:MAG: hypothetical protein ACKOB6_09155, partial [Candidatus Kapaibacterium sp.]
MQETHAFLSSLPAGPKILVEVNTDEERSPWDASHDEKLISGLRHLDPVYILHSETQPRALTLLQGLHDTVVWCTLSVRQAAELYNHCDAFIGTSSTFSFIIQSDLCRSDVPFVEVARMAEASTLEYCHHQIRKICVDMEKFSASIDWLVRVLGNDPAAERVADMTFSDVYITEKKGKFEYVSSAIMAVRNERLESVEALERVLSECGPYTFLYGGLGDALLGLSAPLDNEASITVVASANSIPAAESLLSSFPSVKRVVFLPKPARYMLTTTVRFICITHAMCTYHGTTPVGREDESWTEDFDLTTQPGVLMHPRW